ncbi:MAG: choice-of-anchor D domain-containing protein, partial [Candidatus Krumholzibacteriota bacterium]|nr:choice-of-anchor D domain-containing protein [Candidatus Krumholzibacteriota bacterium]
IVTGGGPFMLEAGEDLLATVRFAPTAYGDHSAVVTTGCAPCGSVACTGFGDSPPLCEVTPAELAFGDVPVGESTDRAFAIANAGGGTLFGAVALDDPDFAIVYGEGPFILHPGQELTVVVRFTPPSVGLFEAAVDLGTENCPDVPCQGRGAPYEDYGNHVGLFADAAGTVCEAPLAAGETDTLHLLAVLPDFADPGIVAATLRVENLPLQDTGGWYWAEWEGEATGYINTGVTVSFAAPQTGGFVSLGRVIFEVWDDGWLTEDHVLQVGGAGAASGPTVTDPDGQAWEVYGGHFTFNCGVPGTCDCEDFSSPVCVLEPEFIDFGVVQTGAGSDRSFTVTNTAYGTMEGALSVEGACFSLVSGAGPFALQHGESHTGVVRFQPASEATYTGAVLTGLDDCPELPLEGEGTGVGYDYDFIGVFAEANGNECYEDVPLYSEVVLHVMAYIPSYASAGVTAVEFRIDDLPENLGYPVGMVQAFWDTDLVIGDPWYGVSLAFAEPLYGTFVHLGTLSVMAFQDGWIGDDYLMQVVAAYQSGNLVIVDSSYQEHTVAGGQFTFNCSYPDLCTCLPWVVPATVSLFELEAEPGAVTARWESASPDADFRLETAADDGATWEVAWTETAPGAYAARDASPRLAAGGRFTYTLQGRVAGGDWELLRSQQLDVAPAPRPTRLAAPHPNPFNPSVTIPFSLSAPQLLRLAVFDVAGRLVRTLHDGPATAGDGSLIWDGRDDAGRPAGTGVYFVRMQAAGFAASRKLVLLR